LAASWLALACGDDSSSDAGSPDAGSAGSGMGGMGGDAVSFAEDIHPILLAKCSGSSCHSAANPFLPGHAAPDVDDAYEATQSTSTLNGPVYERIAIRGSGASAAGFMPPSCSGPVGAAGCLTEEELALIDAWVAADAPP
jgi:hypothetical protein